MNYEKRVSVYRGHVEESVHFGAAAVVNSKGELIHSIGNPELVTFPRSALKFIQAIALVETGAYDALGLDDRHLSLACASHMGEPIHINLVKTWLRHLDLDENALACGPDYPLDKQACQRILKNAGRPQRHFHNCSGKHTGFLSVCKYLGFPVEGYHLLEHPVQQLFVKNLSELSGIDATGLNWAVDGCGFPAPAMRLREMAYCMAKFADSIHLPESKKIAAQRIKQAIASFPEYMSGTDNLARHVINATNAQVLVKIGAEGFFIAVIPSQSLGIALKIADGSARGAENFIVNLLDELGFLDQPAKQKLSGFLNPEINNSRNEIVGKICSNKL